MENLPSIEIVMPTANRCGMNNEVKTTSQEIVSRLKLKEMGAVFGSIASPFIIIFSINRFVGFSDNLFELILTLTVSIVFILLLFFLIAREIMSSRKDKYANITEKHHFCFHTTRDILSFLNELDAEQLTKQQKEHAFRVATNGFIKVLDSVATIYSMLTGTRCRATIKTIYEKNGKLFVRTLARDSDSYEHNYDNDKKRFDDNQDAIEENEDFELLYGDVKPGQSCFFSNNLIERRNYKTSSFKVYGDPNKEMGWYDRAFCKGWTLPYRGAIVWPIQQKENRYFTFAAIGCIGFLAVDSGSRGVFKRNWDSWLGAGIADAIFHPINTLFNVIEQPKTEGT